MLSLPGIYASLERVAQVRRVPNLSSPPVQPLCECCLPAGVDASKVGERKLPSKSLQHSPVRVLLVAVAPRHVVSTKCLFSLRCLQRRLLDAGATMVRHRIAHDVRLPSLWHHFPHYVLLAEVDQLLEHTPAALHRSEGQNHLKRVALATNFRLPPVPQVRVHLIHILRPVNNLLRLPTAPLKSHHHLVARLHGDS